VFLKPKCLTLTAKQIIRTLTGRSGIMSQFGCCSKAAAHNMKTVTEHTGGVEQVFHWFVCVLI